MQIRAFAKINLYLAIVGKRTDGYHDVESVLVRLPDLFDSLTVEHNPGGGIVLSCEGLAVPCDRTNLVWRAAEEFSEAAGINADWRVHLAKQIPIAAGLGGGSSDAAATLLAMRQLSGAGTGEAELRAIGSRLGADVPFFLCDGPCIARGIGDVLSAIPAGTPVPVVLINPRFPVSTAWAYNTVTAQTGPGLAPMLEALVSGEPSQVAGAVYNGFEEIVFAKFPLLEMIAESARAAGALCVRLSGSGATLFAVLESIDAAGPVCRALEQQFGDMLWLWCGWTESDIGHACLGRMQGRRG